MALLELDGRRKLEGEEEEEVNRIVGRLQRRESAVEGDERLRR